MTLSNRQKYLVDELWILAWNASVQRAGVYSDTVKRDGTDRRIAAFKATLIKFIIDMLVPSYLEECDPEEREKQHYKNIAKLVEFENRNDPAKILGKDGYRYGIAQKLLNLMLKYLWCAEIITEPPHCPVDRIVIDEQNIAAR